MKEFLLELKNKIPGLLNYRFFKENTCLFIEVKYKGKAPKFKPFIIKDTMVTWNYDTEDKRIYLINQK